MTCNCAAREVIAIEEGFGVCRRSEKAETERERERVRERSGLWLLYLCCVCGIEHLNPTYMKERWRVLFVFLPGICPVGRV